MIDVEGEEDSDLVHGDGIAQGAGCGKFLAQWMLEGDSEINMTGFDPRRLGVYADADYCKCVYIGTEAAYDRYQKLEVKQRIAENEEAASMNWGVWGGWGPWY